MKALVFSALLLATMPIQAQEIVFDRRTEQYSSNPAMAEQISEMLVQRALDIRMHEWRIYVRFVPLGTPEENYAGMTTVIPSYMTAYISLDLFDLQQMPLRTVDETIVHELMHVVVGKTAMHATDGAGSERMKKYVVADVEALVTKLSRMFIWGRYAR